MGMRSRTTTTKKKKKKKKKTALSELQHANAINVATRAAVAAAAVVVALLYGFGSCERHSEVTEET